MLPVDTAVNKVTWITVYSMEKKNKRVRIFAKKNLWHWLINACIHASIQIQLNGFFMGSAIKKWFLAHSIPYKWI